jgi:hypothetical protein
MVSVTYTHTRRDSLAFTAHWALHSAVIWSLLGLLVVVTLPETMRSLRPGWPLAGRIAAAVALEAIPVFLVVVLTGIVTALIYALYANPGVYTSHTITADGSGLTESTSVNDTTFTWGGVRKIARSSGHIYIYVGPWMAHVIPRRAVSSQEEWDGLYSDLLALQASASA